MTELTRRPADDPHQTGWHVYFGDVRIGAISTRAGVPKDLDQWGWSCGFYPGLHPGQHQQGTGADFEDARAGFEEAWNLLLPEISDGAFDEWRRSQAFTAWKYRMWDEGCRMPTQQTSGRSRCFCGAAIDLENTDRHIQATHADMR